MGNRPTTRPDTAQSPAASGRTLRTMFSTGLTIVLTVALGVSITLASEPQKLLVRDTFDRASTASWGESDNGMRWMNPTGRSGFALASGKAVMTVSGRGRSHEATLNTDVRDVTMEFDFSLDKATGGSGAKVMAVLRKSKAGSYRVRVRLGREGRVWLSVAKTRGQSTSTIIGQPVLIKSWRYRAGQTVSVRAQAIKKDSTQLRVKAWPAGSAQPARVAARPQRYVCRHRRHRASRPAHDGHATRHQSDRHRPLRRSHRQPCPGRRDGRRHAEHHQEAACQATASHSAHQAHRHDRAGDPGHRHHGGHADLEPRFSGR